jgi:hypothetical protein
MSAGDFIKRNSQSEQADLCPISFPNSEVSNSWNTAYPPRWLVQPKYARDIAKSAL